MSEHRQPAGGSTPVRRRRRRSAVVAAVSLLVLAALAFSLGSVAGAGRPHTAAVPDATGTESTETDSPPPPGAARPTPAESPVPVPLPPGASAHSVDDPASIWVVVNKRRPLGDYTPADLVDVPVAHTWEPMLRQEASDAVVALFHAASTEAGLDLASNSAYRAYSAQARVYDAAVAANGQAAADASIARPGSSEHQTGLAIDVGARSGQCSLNACFADTPEGRWLAGNAWRFGFLLRYPADKVAVTGYEFEPWHYRYIGTDLAADLHARGVTTLEEHFALPAAPGYE